MEEKINILSVRKKFWELVGINPPEKFFKNPYIKKEKAENFLKDKALISATFVVGCVEFNCCECPKEIYKICDKNFNKNWTDEDIEILEKELEKCIYQEKYLNIYNQ